MESSATRIGTEIAGFRIESVLGRGGMSVVYLAEQTRLGRKVALKVLASGLADRDDLFRERFLQESNVAASLDHPNIIPIYDAGEDNGCFYIAMRYVEGRDLSEVLAKEGALSLGRTLFILQQVAGGLDAAHEAGLIHRDVKPANVLMAGDTDRVYLTDFGVAKPTTSAGLTRTGFFIGTPNYSAPEQIEGKEIDARTDVYALGGVLYSCLSGLMPYERDSEVAVLQAHLLSPPPSLKEARPDLPRGLDRVVATAMAKAKEDRYSSCGELADAAVGAARDRPAAASIATEPEPDQGIDLSSTVLATDPASTAAPTAADPNLTAAAADPNLTAAAPAAAASASSAVDPASTPPSAETVQASEGAAADSSHTTAPTGAAPPVPSGRRLAGRRLWIVAGAALFVLVLAGAGAGLAVTMGSSSSKHLSALEQAVVQANQSVKANGMFPLDRCHDKMLQGGIEQLSCPNVWNDVSAVVFRYPSLTSLYAAYHRDFSGFRLNNGSRLAANSRNCIGSGATGEAAWRHPPYPVQTTKVDPSMPATMVKGGWEGRVFCGQSTAQPFQFEWTFDPGLILGIATSLDHTDVWTWWHALHHNLLIGSMSMSPSTTGAMTPTSPPSTAGAMTPTSPPSTAGAMTPTSPHSTTGAMTTTTMESG